MTVRISQKTEGEVALYDEKDNLLKTFEVKENLQRALQLLKQLNSVKTSDGVPIYKTKEFKGASIWSFYQYPIFWLSLRAYAQYEEVITFLIKNGIKKVIIDERSRGLKKYLEANGIEVIGPSLGRKKMFSLFVHFCMKSLAALVTFLAFLKLLFSRTSVLIYTPDNFTGKYNCDFRFYPVYQYLKEKKIRHIEAFHTFLDYEFLKNLIRRKRLAFYLNIFPIFPIKKGESKKYNLSVFEPHNQTYLSRLLKTIDQRLENNIRRTQILTALLKFTGIKILLSIDDVRYTNELILACKSNKIKTYGFQHGWFPKYRVDLMNYNIPGELSVAFDKLFTWNDYWRKVLAAYSTKYNKENIEVSGPLREPKTINFRKKESKIEKVSDLKILVPYEVLAPKKEVGDFLNRFIDLGIKVFLKVRPTSSADCQLEQYNIKNKEKIELIKDINEDILSEIDAVAGVYSTFLYEMIFYEIPAFVFETSCDIGHQLTDDKLAVTIKKDFNPSSLLDYINNYQSKKSEAWPKTPVTLKETLDKLLSQNGIN